MISVREIVFILSFCGGVWLLMRLADAVRSQEFRGDLARLRQNRAIRRAARRKP